MKLVKDWQLDSSHLSKLKTNISLVRVVPEPELAICKRNKEKCKLHKECWKVPLTILIETETSSRPMKWRHMGQIPRF